MGGTYGALCVALVNTSGLGIWSLLPLAVVPLWSLRTALVYRRRRNEQFEDTVHALLRMLQHAHPYTEGHVDRVGKTAEQVGLKLGLPRTRARALRTAALLHDIGKLAVDEQILDKPAKLTPQEIAHIRRHSEAGAAILTPVKELREMAPRIRHHHERPDGSGYPMGLAGEEIPLESRVIAVLDAYDAMTGGEDGSEKRSYRESISPKAALEELERCSGTQFDGKVVKAFRECLAEVAA